MPKVTKSKVTKPKPTSKATSLSAARAIVSRARDALSSADNKHSIANILHDNASYSVKGKVFLVKEAREKLNKALEEEKMAKKDQKKKKAVLDQTFTTLKQADLEYKAAVSEELSWVVKNARELQTMKSQ